MDDIKNSFADLINGFKDRVRNPFLAAFVIAWSVWNFKILFVFISDGEWKDKINYIYIDLMKTKVDWFIHGYFIPTLAALVWIFLMPYFMRFVIVWSEKQKNKTDDNVKQAGNSKILTQDEKNQLNDHINTQWQRIYEEKERNSKVLQDLTSLNKELSLQIEDIEKQNNTLINEKESLSKDAIDYKETIRKLELTISPQKIITQKNDATDREKRLKVLRSLDFIIYGGDDIDYFEVKNKYFNFTYPLKTAAELEYEGKNN